MLQHGESNTASSEENLNDLFFTWRDCTRCNLHRNRKLLITGTGLASAHIAVVLDRFGDKAISSGNALAGREGLAVQMLLEEAGADPRVFWYTSVVSCPTGPKLYSIGLQPSAKPSEIKACSGRLHEEIHIIKPHFIFSFGTTALKSICKNPPKESESLGRVIEANIQGSITDYVVPLMPLPSIGAFFKSQKTDALWNKTVEYIQAGLATATELYKLRS
jgi:uracil-DNA glycosylase family 4